MIALASEGQLTKLAWSLPWLMRYPFWRAGEILRRRTEDSEAGHLIFVIANHFEPSWNDAPNEFGGFGVPLDWATQLSRLDRWCEMASAIGRDLHDDDDTPFRHTNFYPAEQYHPSLLERLAQLQAEGFGEVEIHLHHGVERPDTAESLKRTLETFRDSLANEHACLSRMDGVGTPMYAFVHGNWALANSAGGTKCGVDEEMQILAETGCYADLTLPSAPDRSQVPRINAIYQCGHPLVERAPHRSGPDLEVGDSPRLPIILTGPLVIDWKRRRNGIPMPRFDSGVLSANYPLNVGRLEHWQGAGIGVRGRPEWVFIKLYCHGFFPADESGMIGDDMKRFMGEVLELGGRSKQFKVHFATAREAFNIIMAAVDGHVGEPGLYRDYRLRQIMRTASSRGAASERAL